jgi:hypothetical protein
MSDSISSINSLTNASSAQSTTSPYRKIKQDMQALAAALQSGDLGGAQTAFATLQQDAPNLTVQSQKANTTNPRAQALAALGTALQSGNLTQAQQAFATLQQVTQGVAGTQGHHHHHHHSSGSSTDQTASSGSDSLGDLLSSSLGQGASPIASAGTLLSKLV